MDFSSLDFQQARIKLVLFKSRLRSILYGVRAADAALFSPQQNMFGEWLYTILQPQFPDRAEVSRIEQLFNQMLTTGNHLLRLYQQGQIEEARAGLGQIDTLSDQIAQLLQGLEPLDEQSTFVI